MPIHDRLAQYGDFIVLLGFVVGITYIADILPRTVDILDLGEKVKYVYMGIIILAAYTFYKFHKGHSSPVFQRTVDPRTLSTPSNMRDLSRQRSFGAPQQNVRPMPQPPPTPSQMQRPSQGVFDIFNRE